MKKINLVIAAGLGSALSFPAGAMQSEHPADVAAESDADNEVICHRTPPPTGSRIGARNICKTRAEWAAMGDEARATMLYGQRSNSFTNAGRPEVGTAGITGEPAN